MPKLTIILGKRIGLLTESEVDAIGLSVPSPIDRWRYPELGIRRRGDGWVPLHPDDFIPRTLRNIKDTLTDGRDAQLWTMSEYLVSWIAQEVDLGQFTYATVEVRLYADDNKSFRRFGIDRMGRLCNVGDGDWPFGWFMPN